MSRRTRSYASIFAAAVTALTLLISVSQNQSPWAAAVPGLLFLFVVFPRWRGALFSLLSLAVGQLTKAIGKITGRANDPE